MKTFTYLIQNIHDANERYVVIGANDLDSCAKIFVTGSI